MVAVVKKEEEFRKFGLIFGLVLSKLHESKDSIFASCRYFYFTINWDTILDNPALIFFKRDLGADIL